MAGERKKVCDRPGPPAADPLPVHLGAVDRGIAKTTFDQIAEAIAAFEGSPEVSPFSSKFDYVMAGKAEFTPEEKAGYELFRSQSRMQRMPPRRRPGRGAVVHGFHGI